MLGCSSFADFFRLAMENGWLEGHSYIKRTQTGTKKLSGVKKVRCVVKESWLGSCSTALAWHQPTCVPNDVQMA